MHKAAERNNKPDFVAFAEQAAGGELTKAGLSTKGGGPEGDTKIWLTWGKSDPRFLPSRAGRGRPQGAAPTVRIRGTRSPRQRLSGGFRGTRAAGKRAPGAAPDPPGKATPPTGRTTPEGGGKVVDRQRQRYRGAPDLGRV